MRNILTSWKEIAQYMGKGVRTVQRWEAYFGLPVRRPTANSHHAVLAIPAELDAWIQAKTKVRSEPIGGPELQDLRRRIVELQEEISVLRRQLGMNHSERSEKARSEGPVPEREFRMANGHLHRTVGFSPLGTDGGREDIMALHGPDITE
jgi:hypothetical protein